MGVQLNDQQEKQIKTLVEQNDLYGAQRVILDELTTQFGGRFAAAGQDAEGRAAAFNDRIEDLQKTLAGPLLPVIDRARERLITLFESPAAVAAADKLGTTIADLFTDENLTKAVGLIEDGLRTLTTFDFNKVGDGVQKVFGFLGDVPWGAIGEGLKITGQATKTVVDAFLSLPKDVQGVLVAALAVNKLTGGAVGGLITELGKGLIKGVLNMNAGVVNVNAATVNGVPGAAGAAGGGAGRTILALSGVGVAALLAAEFEEEIDGFAQELHDSLIPTPISGLGPDQWQWPFGSKNPPGWLPDFLGGPGPDMSNPFGLTREEGRAALERFLGPRRTGPRDQSLFPNFSEARNADRPAVLPDTAMLPVTTAINGLRDAILTDKALGQNTGTKGRGIFVQDVKLDPSQVTDMREPTRKAAEQLRMLTLDARAADQASRTAAAFQTAELGRLRSDQRERLTNLAAKYDAQNAQLSGANRHLGVIASKNPIHPVTVNNAITIPVSISATLLEQRIIQARMASVGAYSATGAQIGIL